MGVPRDKGDLDQSRQSRQSQPKQQPPSSCRCLEAQAATAPITRNQLATEGLQLQAKEVRQKRLVKAKVEARARVEGMARAMVLKAKRQERTSHVKGKQTKQKWRRMWLANPTWSIPQSNG